MTDWTSARAWSRHGWRTHLSATAAAPVPAGPVPAGLVPAGLVPAGPVPAGPVPAGGEGTIPGLAAASARRVPDRVAVSVDGQPVTHGQLDADARRAAAWLAARLVPGDRMLL